MSMRLGSCRLLGLFVACGGLMLLAAYAVFVSLTPSVPVWSDRASTNIAEPVALAAPPAFEFRKDIAPQHAVEINSAIPVSTAPVLPAKPFAVLSPGGSTRDQMSAVDCLTAAVYYEAASETIAGQRAVAQVVLNRVRHPAYPKSVCDVVFQGSTRTTGCQFTFTCDGALARKPTPSGWARARSVAVAALSGSVEAGVGLATHYHTQWVVPHWSGGLTKLGSVGAHIFYRWNGRTGMPGAFSGRYSGKESVPSYAARHLTGFFLATAEPSLVVEDLTDTGTVIDSGSAKAYAPSLVIAPRGELSSAPSAPVGADNGQLRQPEYRLKTKGAPQVLLADQGKLIDQP